MCRFWMELVRDMPALALGLSPSRETKRRSRTMMFGMEALNRAWLSSNMLSHTVPHAGEGAMERPAMLHKKLRMSSA